MEQTTYADRKSRLVTHRAGRPPENRTVGCITIHAAELPRPLVLYGGYTVVIEEGQQMDLREAAIHLEKAYGRTPWWQQALIIILIFVLGCIFEARLLRF